MGVIHEEFESGSAGHSVEVAQARGGCIVDLLFGAIQVILHGCLCLSKPIQNTEEVIY